MATAGVIATPTRGPLGPLAADTAKVVNHFVAGTAAVAAGTRRFYNDTDRPLTITSVRASADTAPTGATLIVDVNVDGTTVFTTQSKRPAIAVSTKTKKVTDIEAPTVPAGSYVSVDIDQIGSTVEGANVSVDIVMVPA